MGGCSQLAISPHPLTRSSTSAPAELIMMTEFACNMRISDKLAGLGYATPQSPSLTVASQCVSTCPGHTLTLECTTVGPGITVWRGSAFNCSGNNILLRHSQFMSPYGVNGTCNNGEIIGYSLRVTADNCFTSLLNVTVSPGLIGQTIQCAHNNGQSLNPIGLHRIDIRTGIAIFLI